MARPKQISSVSRDAEGNRYYRIATLELALGSVRCSVISKLGSIDSW
jgi:hypothetical protein